MLISGLNYIPKNIKGKIAVISDEANLSSALLTMKNIKSSEIDLYVESKNNTILINDIKDFNENMICSEGQIFKYSVSEIFSPLEYNAVICVADSSIQSQITTTCTACATPVVSINMETTKACIA